MVDFNCCDHECACQHNGHLEAAQQYSSILSKVMSKNADSEYVSKEDKDKWNNKANQDVVDLIKMMVEKHEEKLDELEEGLDKKVKLILYDLGFGDNVLAKYATIEYVNELVAKIKNDTADLSKYALKTDLDTIKNDIQNKINNLATEINNIKVTGGKDYSIESMEYNDNQLVLKQKNGGTFIVSIASGNVDTSKFVTKEQLAAELTKYAEINKLKRIRVKGNVHSLYGNGDEIIDIPTGSGDGDGKDGKDGEATTGQTFKGSPLRMSREVDGQTLTTWKSGLKYYDGKRDAEDGVFYQDVVIYNNMYYVCINTEAGESDQWKTAPDAASYWKVFAVTENFVADKIIANQAYIKELSSEEVVIFDGSTIVAGMTSSKKVDERSDLNGIVTNKGDVRIWAGELKSSGDLTSAPFTVTDAGVLKCQSEEGNSITLQDGTIYFNINGSVYHLGITNGKPDWINSNAADSTETWYQKSGSDTNLSFSQVGTFAIKDNKYYTDATMRTPVSGTYYKKVDAGTILYKVEPYTYLTYGYIFGVEVYNKATFTNGSKVNNGTVAITGAVHTQTIPSENGGTLNVVTTNKTWAKITRVDKPTGTFTYYLADQSGSSDSVPYTNIKSDDITFNYNTNNGIYVISASDTESPNLASTLSSWRQNIGTGSSDNVYEIINNNLTGGFIIS